MSILVADHVIACKHWDICLIYKSLLMFEPSLLVFVLRNVPKLSSLKTVMAYLQGCGLICGGK